MKSRHGYEKPSVFYKARYQRDLQNTNVVIKKNLFKVFLEITTVKSLDSVGKLTIIISKVM